jgi:hypothetical protein
MLTADSNMKAAIAVALLGEALEEMEARWETE